MVCEQMQSCTEEIRLQESLAQEKEKGATQSAWAKKVPRPKPKLDPPTPCTNLRLGSVTT